MATSCDIIIIGAGNAAFCAAHAAREKGASVLMLECVPEDMSPQVTDKMYERWWARKDSNLRPMDYESKPNSRRLH